MSFNLFAAPLLANLIPDPGFEGGTTTGLWGGSVVVTSNQRSGSHAAELRQTDPQWGGGYERTITGLTPNTPYRFSAYVKTVGGSAVIGVKNHGFAQASQSFDSATYILQEIIFTTGPSATSATCFVWNNPGNASLAYTDDLSLVAEGPVETPVYQLIFSDEFNTNGPINSAKWNPEIGFLRNQEAQYYTDSITNLRQSGGNLVITAKREQYPNPNYIPGSSDWRFNRQFANWTSGSIKTDLSFDFLYGRIECRAKVTNLTGTWPAIWTVGTDIEWPAGGEIDIMENYGGNVLANFATSGNNRWTAAWDSYSKSVSTFPAGWVDQYHIWELEWSPTLMTIRLDGVELNSFDPSKTNTSGSYAYPNVAPFQTFGQFLFLNLAIGGTAGGSTAALPDETVYLVDYIRVYQLAINPPSVDIARVNTSDLDFGFDSVKGKFYSLYENTDLSDPSGWARVANIRGTGAAMTLSLVNGIDAPAKFFVVGPDNSDMVDTETPVE